MDPLNIPYDQITIPQLGMVFNCINRLLISAESEADWQASVRAMDQFLDVLSQQVLSDPELIARSPNDSSRVFSILLTLAATGTQYRLEQYLPKDDAGSARRALIDDVYLSLTGRLRQKALRLAKDYLAAPVFNSLREALDHEILPLLDSMDFEKDHDRWMPFRVIQIGNIYERLIMFRLRTQEALLIGDAHSPGLLRTIYDRKYLRFGTSGVRARWGVDFTERRAKQVVQAVCDYLNDLDVPDFVGRENLSGRRIVIGYDTRRNADRVAEWAAQVCLANGFQVDFANRDTPTPALVYYLTEHLPPEEVAG
ncbi:MAG: hypothetical protein GX142_07815 [Chloroflexi bacterium]|nr:hypothetical protein [Chloroflexota bacterium]